MRAGATLIGAVAVAVGILAAGVYIDSLRNGLVYDDVNAISLNLAAHDPWAWRTIVFSRSWFAEGEPTIAWRPLTTWTFALNYRVGGLDPVGYHAGNVALHALVSALVPPTAAAFGLTAWGCLAAGALFAVHPLHTEVVANVVGRAELLVAAAGLGGLLAARRRGWTSAAIVVLLYGAALLAKENAVCLLVLLPLAAVVDRDGLPAARPRAGLRAGCLAAALVVVSAGYALCRTAALGSVFGARATIATWQNPLAHASLGDRLRTALWILTHALRLLAVGQPLSADYSYRQIPLVTSWADPRGLAGLGVGLALLLVVGLAGRSGGRTFFWVAFGLCAYAPVSNLVVPGGTIFADRLLYLPSVAAAVLLGEAIARARPGARLALGAAMAIGLVGWSARTVDRIAVWRSDLTLAEALGRDAPDSAHAHHLRASAYAALGRDEEALVEFVEALKIDPTYVASLYDGAQIHVRHGQLDAALEAFEAVNEIDPRYFAAWINRAAIRNQLGDYTTALACAETAVTLRPDVPNVFVVRGFALRGLERFVEARRDFETAIRLAPEMSEALIGLGTVALDQGDVPVATATFERLVVQAPSPTAYEGLIASYARAGREADRARAAATARALFGEPAPP